MEYVVRFAASPQEREAAFSLRREVFEVEQGVPRPLDRDPFDLNADHAIVLASDRRCVGTGRVVRLDSRVCQLGRQVTAADHRGRGVGALVLGALERMATLRGLADIQVHAQLPAQRFYSNRGYTTASEIFLEQGVPHVLMRKALGR